MRLSVLGNPSAPAGSRARFYSAVGTAAAAGLFCVVLMGMMTWMRVQRYNPQGDPKYAALTARFAHSKTDLKLKEEIRQLDLRLRDEYFYRKLFAQRAGWLLLGGAIVLVISLRSAMRYRPTPTMLPADVLPAPDPLEVAIAKRWAIGSAGMVLAGGTLAVLCIWPAPGMPPEPEKQPEPVAIAATQPVATTIPATTRVRVPSTWPTAQQLAANWASFRGPGGSGIATGEFPTEWDGKAGKNIVWKQKVALPGESSPVVWGDRVFVTGATEKKREVYCLSADKGDLLWTGEVPGEAGAAAPKVNADTGYAAPTVVADGQHVAAIFASGDMGCFDFSGKLLWHKSLGVPDSMYGYSASLAMWHDSVIVQFDQGAAEDGKSFLYAFDIATGDKLWETKRDVGGSWASPIVVSTPKGDQIITAGKPWVIAYNPEDGKELWRCEGIGNDPAPSPIYAGGKVFATVAYSKLLAIQPDGQGNVTDSKVAWESTENLPDAVSPVSDGEFVFLIDGNAKITCLDAAKKGEKVWEEVLEKNVYASPVIAGKRLYILDRDGVMHVLEVGRAFKELAKLPLGEQADTSPAFVGGKIFIRGKQHLFCIGTK